MTWRKTLRSISSVCIEAVDLREIEYGATSRPKVEIVGIRPWTTGASFTLDKVKVHIVIRAHSALSCVVALQLARGCGVKDRC